MIYSAYKLNNQGDIIQAWCIPFLSLNQSIILCLLLTVASSPAYRFLRRQVRWSGVPIPWRIFHSLFWSTVKGFDIDNKAEVDVFLELSCFSYDPMDVDNLISGSSAFLNPAWTAESSWFTYCWSLAWRILRITLLECEMSATGSLNILWHCFFFGIGMKIFLFQSCGHCWVFQICWHIGCSTFTASFLRIWNSLTGIPSPPLTLFVVMLPKSPLTLPSKISCSMWVITPSWLPRSWRSFLYSSSVYIVTSS